MKRSMYSIDEVKIGITVCLIIPIVAIIIFNTPEKGGLLFKGYIVEKGTYEGTYLGDALAQWGYDYFIIKRVSPGHGYDGYLYECIGCTGTLNVTTISKGEKLRVVRTQDNGIELIAYRHKPSLRASVSSLEPYSPSDHPDDYGIIVNKRDYYLIVRSNDSGYLYICKWLGGSKSISVGDEVQFFYKSKDYDRNTDLLRTYGRKHKELEAIVNIIPTNKKIDLDLFDIKILDTDKNIFDFH